MKINKLFVIVTILVAAGLGYAQQGGNTKGYKLRHASFGNVIFTKGTFRTQFNLRDQSVGCVQATAAMLKNDTRECVISDKAEYQLIDVVQKGGKYYLLIINEAPSGNTGCDACRRCGADGANGLIFIEVGPGRKIGKRQSIPLADCNSFATMIGGDGKDTDAGVNFKGDIAEFRTRMLVEQNPESYYELTDWRYDRRSPEKGIVAVKKEKEKEN